jgi:(+)-pinoresinol hydroxylase
MKRYLPPLLVLSAIVLHAADGGANHVGHAVFKRHCSHCHAPGIDHPGTMLLSVTRGEAFSVLEQRNDLTAEYVRRVVREGLKTMPAFKPTTLTNEELEALADYLKK